MPKDYVAPNNISIIGIEDWPVIIDSAVKLLSTHENILHTNSNGSDLSGRIDAVKNDYENKITILKYEHENRIMECQKQLESKFVEEISLLNKQNENHANTIKQMNDIIAEKSIENEKDKLSIVAKYNAAIQEERDEHKELINKEINKYNSLYVLHYQSVEDNIRKLNELSQEERDKHDNMQKDMMQRYNDNIENERKRYAETLEDERKRHKDIYESLRHDKELLENIINQEKQRQENVYKHYEEKISKLESIIIQSNEELSDKIKVISDPITKFYGGSNYEKGTSGENFIMNLLKSDIYLDAVVKDVSGATASGDILFKWKNIKCLIEVKNKQKITQGDLDKFERDVKKSFDAGVINCGIFVSLLTNEYPGKSRREIQIEFINNIPVIYIHITSSTQIVYAITCLENILTYNNSENIDQIKVLSEQFRNYKKSIEADYANLDKIIKTREKELKYYKKKYNEYAQQLEEIGKINTKFAKTINNSCDQGAQQEEKLLEECDETYDELCRDLKTKDLQDTKVQEKTYTLDLTDPQEAKEKVKDVIIKRLLADEPVTATKLLTIFNIQESEMKILGGYTNIFREAKDKHLGQVMINGGVDMILEHKKSTGSWPEKKFITPDIISIRNYNRLNKVLKVTKILDAIHDYAERQGAARQNN